MWLPFSSLRITVWWFQPTPMNSTMFINKVTWDHHPQVKLTARCIKLSILNVIYTCVCIYIYICLHCTDVCVCIQYYTIIYIYIYIYMRAQKIWNYYPGKRPQTVLKGAWRRETRLHSASSLCEDLCIGSCICICVN